MTDHEILAALESPLVVDEYDVGRVCGAGTGCGGCLPEIRRLCEQARDGVPGRLTSAA